MEVTITLPDQTAMALIEAARRQGTTPELLAADALRKQFAAEFSDSSSQEGQNLADFLAGYIGIVDSRELIEGGARMSENCGDKFAAGMMEKRDQGRL